MNKFNVNAKSEDTVEDICKIYDVSVAALQIIFVLFVLLYWLTSGFIL